jgi:hypothetical protein
VGLTVASLALIAQQVASSIDKRSLRRSKERTQYQQQRKDKQTRQ